ncbi:MAG: carboxylate--amine ligase [Betaproteobacteria bacterium]|nr:carboxylate--amine ligase [Betaproteobacteria bacterium]
MLRRVTLGGESGALAATAGAGDSAQPARAVLLLGIDTPIGLALVRELAGHGVAVHGIARSARAPGLRARGLASGHCHGPRDAALLALLRDLAWQHGARHCFAVSESDIAWLNRHRECLPGLTLMMADGPRLARVLDKASVYRTAAALGIAVPQSWPIADAEAARQVPALARYPVVVKWADPNRVADRLRALGLPLEKARYCHDAAELAALLARYAPVGEYPLVQAQVPGEGMGQMLLMHEGRAVLRFEHRRLREWPPEGGTATCCESVDPDRDPALMAQSEALLRALEWSGPAMVEYRHDPASGRSVLMEVNGRYWGSYPLAQQAGAHFAWTHLRLVAGLPASPAAPEPPGRQCRFLVPDTRRLLRILFAPGQIADRSRRWQAGRELWRYLVYPIGRRRGHYVFRGSDPLPCLADLIGIARAALRR